MHVHSVKCILILFLFVVTLLIILFRNFELEIILESLLILEDFFLYWPLNVSPHEIVKTFKFVLKKTMKNKGYKVKGV